MRADIIALLDYYNRGVDELYWPHNWAQGRRQRDTDPADSITCASGSLQRSSVDYHTNGDELSNQAIQSWALRVCH